MKGIYYNLQFKTGKDTYLKFTKLSMRELCDKIKNNMELVKLVSESSDRKFEPKIIPKSFVLELSGLFSKST